MINLPNAAEHARIVVWHTNFEDGTRSWTAEAARLFGLDVEPGVPIPFVERDHLFEIMYPEDRPLLAQYHHLLHRMDDLDAAYRARTAGDGYRRFLGRGRVVRRLSGSRPAESVHYLIDTPGIENFERPEDVFQEEFRHRTGNFLSVIQAIAHQTATSADNTEQNGQSFSNRLAGLSNSFNLCNSQYRTQILLTELIQSQLGPFVSDVTGQLSVTGPSVLVGRKSAQMVAMAFNELATNALKYGALSGPHGNVTIRWQVDGQASTEPGQLKLFWREHGGPAVSPPVRTGFGTIVLRDVMGSSLGAETELHYHSRGVEWSCRVPVDVISR